MRCAKPTPCRVTCKPGRCRYEGEFHSGFAHGLGMYSSPEGEIYRGEFLLGKRNGCAAFPANFKLRQP